MERPKRIKRVIKCEVCEKLKRLVGSSRVWVEAVSTNPITNKKTFGGYMARICKECRPKVGYAKRKNKNEK